MLVGLIPAATAIQLYTFLGNFFAAHLLLAIAALVGLRLPGGTVKATVES